MLRKMKKVIKGQSTAEYAILIALVIAAIVAMQTFVGRALKGRARDAASYMVTQTSQLGNTLQYEPYYDNSMSEITRDQFQVTRSGLDALGADAGANIARKGWTKTVYNGDWLTGIEE